jgi:hypothetical protein
MPPIRANDFNGDFSQFLARYNYQPELTHYLDSVGSVPFSQGLINEIVL